MAPSLDELTHRSGNLGRRRVHVLCAGVRALARVRFNPTGVISGISNAGTNCTGVGAGDGRRCNVDVPYVPFRNFFGNNGNWCLCTSRPIGG